MEESELTPEQEAQMAALVGDLEREVARVGVDLQQAFAHVRESAPRTERRISDDEMEMEFLVDVGGALDLNGMLQTLRGLPAGAGTQAFLAAYHGTR